jgi:hypothetical protein
MDIFVHQQKCNALKNIDNLALTDFKMSNSCGFLFFVGISSGYI